MGLDQLGPEGQRILLWSLCIGVLSFGALLLKRWLFQKLEANERIPPKRWFIRVSKSLARLSRRLLRLEHTVKRLDERQSDQIKNQREDHARIHVLEDKVGRLEVKMELDGE